MTQATPSARSSALDVTLVFLWAAVGVALALSQEVLQHPVCREGVYIPGGEGV